MAGKVAEFEFVKNLENDFELGFDFETSNKYLCAFCRGEIQDITGSYNDIGIILRGYSCTKCFRHLYQRGHVVLRKVRKCPVK